MTEDQIKHMVNRFLGWNLPDDFSPDGGVSFERISGRDGPYPFPNKPVGTNLLTSTQAEAMVRYMLDGMSSTVAEREAGTRSAIAAAMGETH